MADKSVGELIAAQSVTPTDLFVLEQNGTAKKLTGQILENWLVSFADGHGGIQSIVKKGTSGLVDTYRITLADTTTFDFVVTNGRGITGISKTSTSGLVDTYTISYNNGTTSKFTVTNGAKGDKGDDAYAWIKYASQEPTESSHSIGDIPDDWIGIYSGNASTAPTDWKQYKWYRIKGEQGDTGDPATIVSASITYQAGDSGTIIPSGSWSSSVPSVASGRYLWTRQVLQFNTGSPITSYSVSRFGIDGTGSVSTVAGISPDATGNVPLTAAYVKALPISGGTMEGSINMNGQKITGLNAPTKSNEVATKGYVDNAKPNLTGYATETYVNNSVGSKVDKSSVVNNFTTTKEGFVADARAIKELKDSIDKFAGNTIELLWENASPNSDFSAQMIAIDFTGFDMYAVLFRCDLELAYNKPLEATHVGEHMAVSHLWANDDKYYSRGIYGDAQNLNFRDGYKNKSKNNSVLIPIRVYGIKIKEESA